MSPHRFRNLLGGQPWAGSAPAGVQAGAFALVPAGMAGLWGAAWWQQAYEWAYRQAVEAARPTYRSAQLIACWN